MEVIYQKKESVAVIAFDRAGSKNAIKTPVVTKLEDIGNEISGDEDIRVIVVTAKEAFWVVTYGDERALFQSKAEFFRDLSVVSVIGQFDQPTIASMNGDTFGQALELALACDLRICSETSHFAMNHLTYGAIPWDGGTQRLSRVIGQAKAMEMILTGEVIDAEEAYRIGLVSKVVTPEEVMPVTMEIAREMASKGPIALRYAKEAINKGVDLTLEQGLRLEADLYFLLHTTKDRTEGIKAFREKRTPEFEGR